MAVSSNFASKAIGIFDSGIGGLSVAKAVHRLLPQESLRYVADTLYAPYGEKTDGVIYQRMQIITERLLQLGSKALVVACNTATTAAIDALRAEYTLPIIGVEPGVKPAVMMSQTRVVGVLATPRTLQTPSFALLAERFAQQATILLQPCPLLVPLLERMETDPAIITQALRSYLLPLIERGADTLVLGCTHYNFLAEQIGILASALAGKDITIIRTEMAVANQLKSRLQQRGLVNQNISMAQMQFYSSGDRGLFQQQLRYYWSDNTSVDVVLPLGA